MDKVQSAMRSADLLLPKLEAYRKRVGGGDVHDVNINIALLTNYQRMIRNGHRTVSPEQLAAELQVCCAKAEKFLKEVANVIVR